MKKRILLPLLVLGTFSAQARFAATLPFPTTPVTHAPYASPMMNNLTGYIGGNAMTPPDLNGGVTYTNAENAYFYFTTNGLYGAYEAVNVYLDSADPEVQLVGGFDEAPNIWQLKVVPIYGQPMNSSASCTIRVVKLGTAGDERTYNLVLETHY